MGVAGNYLLMMFYTVITCWMLIYFYKYASGSIMEFTTAEQLGGVFGEILGQPWLLTITTFIVIAGCFGICSLGLQNGVERITKGMMIALFGLMILLAIYSCTLDNAADGLKFYLIPSTKPIKELGLWTVISKKTAHLQARLLQ